MKQCPKCNSTFPDEDRFCEVDGTPLFVSADSTSNTTINPARDKRILPLIAILGVSLGVLLVFGYLTFFRGTITPEVSSNSNHNTQVQIATMLQPTPSAEPSVSASIEPSPSPSPLPSASPSVEASPSPEANATPVELSSVAIGTATGAPALTGHVIIRLVSGAKIEAEEAWQTGEGIWYRKGSVVSLLDPKSVKSIDKAPTAVPTVTKTP